MLVLLLHSLEDVHLTFYIFNHILIKKILKDDIKKVHINANLTWSHMSMILFFWKNQLGYLIKDFKILPLKNI